MHPVDFAKAANVSEAIVSMYLSGKKEPKGKTCIAIAKALNVSLDNLLETGLVPSKEKSPAELTTEDRLRKIVLDKCRREATQEELNRIDKLVDLFLDGE